MSQGRKGYKYQKIRFRGRQQDHGKSSDQSQILQGNDNCSEYQNQNCVPFSRNTNMDTVKQNNFVDSSDEHIGQKRFNDFCSLSNPINNESVTCFETSGKRNEMHNFDANSDFYSLQQYSSEFYNVETASLNNKTYQKVPINVISEDMNNKVTALRNLKADYENILQSLSPFDVVKKDKQQVQNMSERSLEKHEKLIENMQKQLASANEKYKNVLKEHMNILKLQQKTFDQFILNIRSQFMDISDLSVTDVNSKSEEILHRVENECSLFKNTLPIYAFKNDIMTKVAQNQVVIISTDACYEADIAIPLFVCDYCSNGVVSVCEMNAFLAVNHAQRCKELMCNILADTVGYNVGKISNITEKTRIVYTTIENLFSGSMIDSKFLSYSCVIINGLINRTVEIDILFENLQNCLKIRPDFKVILLLSSFENLSVYSSYFSSKSLNVSVFSTPNIILPIRTVWKNTSAAYDDYINEIVSTVLAIHSLNDEPGDILSFVASAEDMEKVFKLLNEVLEEYKYTDIKCIALYDDDIYLSAYSYFKKLPESTRKVILATSWAEMLVLPSVSFIIDSGMIQNYNYNLKKNIDQLSTSLITRSRAKIRKAFAGRDISGICYRLYNRENYINEMVNYEVPEVLKKNPFDVMVKIFQYKPNEASTIEFIEPLPKVAKENAMCLLHKYGALKDNQLTSLGQHIVKLPFQPRYSKLIVLGIQWGYAFEAIVLVALLLVKGTFFCNNENSENVDALKLQFLQCDSDTLSYLYVYYMWMQNDFKASWCLEHSIDINVLEQVHFKVQDICSIVKKNLNEDILHEMKLDKKSDFYALQEIIFECFKDNLCVFTGSFKSGYWLPATHSIAFLHSSSLILQKELASQYVVFDHLYSSKFRDYMVNVTSVPENIITTAIQNGVLQVKEADLLEKKLSLSVIEPVGASVLEQVFLSKNGKKLSEMEELLKKETKSDIIVIDPSTEKGCIFLYTLSDCSTKAKDVIKTMLEKKRKSMLCETENHILELEKNQFKVPIEIVLEKGALAVSANLLVTKKLDASSEDKSKSELLIDNELNSETRSIKYSMKLTWLRRCCKGFGFVSFKENDFVRARRLSMRIIEVKGYEIEILLNRNHDNQLYVSNLPPDCSNEDLKLIIEDLLPADIRVQSARVILQPPFSTSEQDLVMIKETIQSVLSNSIKGEEFTVDVQKPENSDLNMSAYVTMKSLASIQRYAKHLNNSFEINGNKVNVETFYHCTLMCSNEVLKALEKRFREELILLERKLENIPKFQHMNDLFCFEASIYDANTRSLILSSENEEIMNILFRTVHKLLEGETIACSVENGLYKIFTHGGNLFLRTVEKAQNVHIVVENKSKTLRLYGMTDACRQAQNRILEFSKSTKNEFVKVVNLYSKHACALLKAVIKKYGVKLDGFIELHKLKSAELDIRGSELVLHGCEESIENAEADLEHLAAEFCSEFSDELLANQEVCSVCACPPLQLTIRLEYCGHLYCTECIKGLIIAEKKFPVKCCAENCDKEILLEDIRKSLDYDETEIRNLVDRSLSDFITKNVDSLAYCPAPDCNMFFDKKKVTEKWNCPLCHNDICISCNAIYHHGYSCEMFQGMKNDADYSYKVWRMGQSVDCRECPKCKMAIERTAGCDHMTCSRCYNHFCWRCLKSFPDGNSVYRHLPYCTENQTRW